MNNQTLYDLDEVICKLNETIQNNVEFLLRSSNVRLPPLTTDDLKEAIRDLDERIKVNADDPISYINRGNAYFYIHNYERAISDYSKFIQIYPDSAKAYLNRGYARFRNSEYDKAVSDYSQAIKIDPVYAEAYDARSSAYEHIGESSQAQEDAEKALELGFDLQDHAEDYTFELIEDLVQLCPKNAKVYYYKGLVDEYAGNYNLAIDSYSEAIRLDPKYAEAYHGRGTAYYYKAQKEEDRAIADYNQAIQFYDKAIADYERAARNGPLHYYELALDVYFKRGKLYAENSDYDSAIADMSRIIELDDSISTDYDEGFRRGPAYDDSYPSNYGSVPAGQAYNDRGFYYAKKGEYDSALADFAAVLRIYNERVELIPESSPDFAIIYLNLGSIYQAKMDYDMAIENYDNVVRICPNYVEDFVNSTFANGGKKEIDRAVKLLKSVVDNSTHSESFAAYYSGVSILFSDNRHRARRRFERARELGFKDDTKIAEHLENLKS